MKNDIITKLQKAAEEIGPSPELLERGKEHVRIQVTSRAQGNAMISRKPQKTYFHYSRPNLLGVAMIVLFFAWLAVISLPGLEAVRKNLEEILPDFLKTSNGTLQSDLKGPDGEIKDVQLKETSDQSEKTEEKDDRREEKSESNDEKNNPEQRATVILSGDGEEDISSTSAQRPSAIETLNHVVYLPDATDGPAFIEDKEGKKGNAASSSKKKGEEERE
jgi:hypothetical protein